MRIMGFLLSLSVVALLSLASSFGLLYLLLGKSTLSLGNDRQIDLSRSITAKLWGSLLGLGAGGFSIGPLLAPENQSVKTLFASYGGDWFLLITATLVLVGLVGGLLSKQTLGGALASGWASLFLAFIGILLTSSELPNLVDLPASQLSQIVSAVEISQLAGGCFSALITGLMGALGGRALLYREKVPIDAVKPPKLAPLQQTTVEQRVEGPADTIAAQPSQEAMDQYPHSDTPGETYGDLGGGDMITSNQTGTSSQEVTEPPGSGISAPTGQEAKGPLSRSPPCPHCGAPLSWVPEVSRYYCKACSVYP